MTGNGYYIGIDIGTTHIKTAVFTEDGRMTELYREHTPESPDGCGTVYRAEEFWRIVTVQLEAAARAAAGSAESSRLADKRVPSEAGGAAGAAGIHGIAVTGMAEAGLVIDRYTGKELTPILPWFDRRTAPLADKIAPEEEEEGFYQTGLRNSFKYGIYKYLWLLEANRLKAEDTVWLSACDYIVYRLTGQMVTDPGFAARTYAYDIVRGVFRSEILAKYGLSEKNFPCVLPSGTAAGPVTALELAKTGLAGVPAAVAGHDHVCAAFAVQMGNTKRICNSAGTAETFVGARPAGAPSRKDLESGMIIGPHVDGVNSFWLANISSSGQSIEWFRRNLQKEEISYEELNKAVTECGPGPTGILYFPYLSGMGTPLFRQDIGGGFLGLTTAVTYREMFRAIMEGLAYHSRFILKEVLEQNSELVCVGGSARSAPWMQIKADILGRDILVPDITEATLLGAVALYAYKNEGKQAGKGLCRSASENAVRYAPNVDSAGRYEGEYQRFLRSLELIASRHDFLTE